jgi:hypothetical protein
MTVRTKAHLLSPYCLKATGFREYDARLLFGKEVQALGMGLGR